MRFTTLYYWEAEGLKTEAISERCSCFWSVGSIAEEPEEARGEDGIRLSANTFEEEAECGVAA